MGRIEGLYPVASLEVSGAKVVLYARAGARKDEDLTQIF